MRFFNSPVLVLLPPTIGKVPRGFADNGDARPADLNGVISFRAGAFVDSLAARVQDAEPASASAIHKVAILLCTYDGQHYLAEQLNSFASQEHTNWELWVSDDGSQDSTNDILRTYRDNWPSGKISIHSGPEESFAANFLSLACKASIEADFYAFSDQDDIWEDDKLKRAVEWLATVPEGTPALYCSRTRLIDSNSKEIGLSPLFSKSPSFANALMQNIGGGNTMVFNNSARALLRETENNASIVSHDWWAYLVVSGCGGKVFYDKRPTVRYRLHNGNLVGENFSWAARLKRIRMLWRGRFRSWNDSNISALNNIQHKLTEENRKVLRRFDSARDMSLFHRLFELKRSGVHRQTLLGNLGLIVAAIFRKL
jgi:glycosyltransferase involved in cell wall biosynthesis